MALIYGLHNRKKHERNVIEGLANNHERLLPARVN